MTLDIPLQDHMPRIATPLTDSKVKNAKPRTKSYKLFDGQGLFIEVKPTGSKLWRLKYRFEGKEKSLTLGSYPVVSLSMARQRSFEQKQELSNGRNPSATRKALKMEKSNSFEAVASDWVAFKTPQLAESTLRKIRLYLLNDINPFIGSRPIKEVKRTELVEVVRKVEERGTLSAASKIRQWLNQIFRYALVKGIVEVNPATDLHIIAVPQTPEKHHPFVPYNELPELIANVDKTNCHIMTKYAIRLLLLTGSRPGELRESTWSEFDLDNALWSIPASRMKVPRRHDVPLPKQAVEILRKIQCITGKFPYVFSGYDPERPMSANTVNKALSIAGYKRRQTGHGFRHLLSTELNSRGYNKDWIERQLAHVDSNKIRETYNHATYVEQRLKMMQEWADSLENKFDLTTSQIN